MALPAVRFLRGLEFVMSVGPSDWFEWAAWRAVRREGVADGLKPDEAARLADIYWRVRLQDAADRLLAEVLAS